MSIAFADITIDNESPEQTEVIAANTPNLRVNYTEEGSGYIYIIDHIDGQEILIHNIGGGEIPIRGYHNGDPSPITSLAPDKFVGLIYSAPRERWLVKFKTP